MKPTPRVRRATLADARALAEIHVRAWQWAYRGQLPQTFLDGLDATLERREAWRQQMLGRAGGEERTWVAETAGGIIGFADTGPSRDADADSRTAELFTIYLEKQVAGTGVGRALLRHAMDDLRTRGYREVLLWVLDTNTRARRFYETAGWRPDGKEKTDQRQDVTLREVRYRIQLEPKDPLRVGLVGLGVGARQLLPALNSSPHGRLVAVADVRPAALERIAQDSGVQTYASVEELSLDPDVEAVWVATPNHLHAEHAIAAAERRKHVIVSKPMAISLQETAAMNAAAERNGVLLLAGHTQSMAPTIRKMASLVASGELGKLGMLHTWHYTDWMYRPRLPAELDVAQGGGPVFRQASHQVDIVRTIAGTPVRSVRAMVVQLDAERGAPGAYTVYLELEDGTPATIVYSGYGHFAMGELLGRDATPSPTVEGDDADRKEALRNAAGAANSLGLFGLTLVTCERGDLRESANGLFLYQRGRKTEIPVQDELRGEAELEELYEAVRHRKRLIHDGDWGEKTLEVCLAIHESARTHAEVRLAR